MRYSELAELYERLESTPKKLEKRDILAEFYRKCGGDLYSVVLLSMGEVFPSGEQELGIARGPMQRIIAKSCGVSSYELLKKFKDTGDLGMTAGHFIMAGKQSSLGRKELTVGKVFDNLRRLPDIEGA